MSSAGVNTTRKTTSDEGRSPAGDRATRQQMLEAARELFLDRGYNGVAMKEVAERVRVTSAALYYHFPGGKQELFFSVIQMILDEWSRGALLATADAQGLCAQLTRLTRYLLTLPMDRFSVLARDIHENMLDRATQRAALEQLQQRFVQHVTDLFQRAIDAGEISREISAPILATMYEGMSISLLRSYHLARGGIERYDSEQLADFVVAVLLRGAAASGTT